jgi:hypothetical protein
MAIRADDPVHLVGACGDSHAQPGKSLDHSPGQRPSAVYATQLLLTTKVGTLCATPHDSTNARPACATADVPPTGDRTHVGIFYRQNGMRSIDR